MDELVSSRNADALVRHILEGSYGMDSKELCEFMQMCHSSAQTIRTEELKKKSMAQSRAMNVDIGGASGGYTLSAGMFLEPRGRFKVEISGGGLALEGKTTCFVGWRNVHHAMILPAHQTSKKDGEDLIAFTVYEPVEMSNGKTQRSFVWKLQKDPKKPEDASTSSIATGLGMETHELIGTESQVITALFRRCWGKVMDSPRPNVFQTLNGKPKPYLQCYNGIQEGVLYPLATGILFMKPMVFLSAGQIDGIVAGRGGSAQTRYIDLVVQDVEGGSHEFTNIDRDELPSLQSYVQLILKESQRRLKRAAEAEAEKENDKKKVKVKGGGASSALAPAPISLDDDSDESDDDDYDPNAPNSDSEAEEEDEGDDDDDDDDDDYDDCSDGKGSKTEEVDGGDDTASEGGEGIKEVVMSEDANGIDLTT